MTSSNQRNIFTANNKHQMRVVFLITAPLFTIAAALLIVAYFMTTEVNRLLLSGSSLLAGQAIAKWFYITVCFIFITLLTFLILAFKLAYDMVNPFNRIITEVDEILITGEKRTITVRPEDELAQEVADRFNKLLARIK